MTDLGCQAKQEIGRWANNRVENSHLPDRQTYKERRPAVFAEWQSPVG